MCVKPLLPLFAVFLLSACGGGGTAGGAALDPVASPPAGEPVPTGTAEILRSFQDGSGIVRVSVATDSDNLVATVLGAQVAEFQIDPALTLDPSALQTAGSNAHGQFYAGQVTLAGTPVSAIYFEDAGGEVALAWFEGNGTVAGIAGGVPASAIPLGSFTYAGTNLVGFRSGRAAEHGTFTMDVDFGAGLASLSGSTSGTAISGSGIAIDRTAGSFVGTGLTFADHATGTAVPATVHGSFHGAGATGVSGLYAAEGNLPGTTGLFAGTR